MSRISRATQRVIGFVDDHKVAFSVVTTATVTTVVVASLQREALKEAYDFIDAAGLTEKFIDSVPYDEIFS